MEARATFEQLVNKLSSQEEVLKDLAKLISMQTNLSGVVTLDPAKYSAEQYNNILVKREGIREVHMMILSLVNGDYIKAINNEKKMREQKQKPKIKI